MGITPKLLSNRLFVNLFGPEVGRHCQMNVLHCLVHECGESIVQVVIKLSPFFLGIKTVVAPECAYKNLCLGYIIAAGD